jgi:multidrug efflux pump subunit AcrA (membrane-fusion protein)
MKARTVLVRVGLGVLVLAIAGGAWWLWRGGGQKDASQLGAQLAELAATDAVTPTPVAITVSGFIEADETNIGSDIGGRIVAQPVDEGMTVKAGDVLVELDPSILQAELAVARTQVEAARAALARLKAGARPEDIRQAEAAVALAEAYRDGAKQAWDDAKRLVWSQQSLDLQIVQAHGQVAVAEYQLSAAGASRDAAEIVQGEYDDAMQKVTDAREDNTDKLMTQVREVPVKLLDQAVRDRLKDIWGDEHYSDVQGRRVGGLSSDDRATVRAVLVDRYIPYPYSDISNQRWLSWVGVNTAQASYEGAVSLVQTLQAQRSYPVAQLARANAAEAAYNAAEAALTQAKARLADLKAGAAAAQIASAEAQVKVAEAGVGAIQARIDRLTLRAPGSGMVLSRNLRLGEIASPGATLLTLANLDVVQLVIYVPAQRLNLVYLGKKVEVQVSSFPGRLFEGEVIQLADKAEYTPDKVQTDAERAALVFAIKVRLPNPEGALKPGMPADVRLEEAR